MKKLFRLISTGLTALVLSGCSQQTPCGSEAERTGFRSVVPHLDTDAAEFALFSGAHFNRTFARVIDEYETILWQQPASGQRSELQEHTALLEMYRKLSGAESLTGIGYSVKTLSDNPYGSAYMHTRIFAAFPPEAPGLMNTFLAKENPLDTAAWLGELPEKTEFAAAGVIAPAEILQALKNSGRLGEEQILEMAENLPLEELSQTAGFWQIILISEGDNFHSALIIPANGKKIADQLLQLAKAIFPRGDITAADGRIAIFSSPEIKQLCSNKSRKLSSRSDFATLYRALPQQAAAMCYAAPGLTGESLPFFAAAARHENGMLLAANGENGLLKTLLTLLLPPLPQIPENAPAASAAPEKCDCEKLLAELKKTLDPSGKIEKLPEKFFRDPSRPRMLLNNRLIIFDANPAVVAISNPQLHDDRFHVLLKNGDIKTFTLPKADSCRRIISFLHTHLHWDETVLRTLLDMAEKFDTTLSKQNSFWRETDGK